MVIEDLRAEEAVLAALLLQGDLMRQVAAAGLRTEHFHRDGHRSIYQAMENLAARGEPIDHHTVAFELERTSKNRDWARLMTDTLAGSVPVLGNVRSYAERVIEVAEWRLRKHVAQQLLEAASEADQHEWLSAQARLEHAARQRKTQTFSPEAWADLLRDYFSREEPPRAIPMPIPGLTELMAGGIWPGETMVVGGWTNHGKSVWVDQILDHAADRGFRCHAYLTEMTAIGRGLRYLSRRTGIPYSVLRERELVGDNYRRIIDELAKIPYGITIAQGWDIDEVVADALHARWDLVVIDLIHGFPYEDERGLDRLSKAMQRLAIQSTTIDGFAGTSVVGVAHLNEKQMGSSPKRPRPGMQSLKGSSSLKQDPDFVSFVWQEDQEDGTPSSDGEIYFTKSRSGQTGKVRVHLNPRWFRFEVAANDA